AASGAWSEEDPGFDVVHITGRRDHDRYRGATSQRYHVIEFTPHLRSYLEQADVVVARAGGSVFEVAAAGEPAILVPSPTVTAAHQTKNAEHFALGGAAVMVPDADLTPTRLRQEVAALLADPERRERMAAAARSLARPDAAAVVADGLLELAR